MQPTPAELMTQVQQAQTMLDAKTGKPPVVQPTVSASEIANPPAKVTPPVPQVNTNTGTATSGLVDNVTTNTQTFIQAKSDEAAKAKELADLLGTQDSSAADQRQGLNDQYGVTGNLARLTDIQTQLTKANTASDLQKTQITSAAGQTLGQGQRELTQQDRENAVRNAGLAAEASVLQGNIETAGTLINNAMSDFYSDRTLKNQNMIQQLDYFSGIADKQTAQLLDQEKRKYEEDQAKVKDVKETVNAAIASGAATAEDMRALTDPTATDEDRLAIAQSVVARGATQMMNLDMAQKSASIRASNASAAANEQQLLNEQAKAKQIADAVSSGAVVLEPEQQKTAMALGKQFEDESKTFKIQANAYNQILASAEDATAAGDLSLIFGYMKMLDPNSVVRETEFANAQNAAGVPEIIRAKYNQALNGERLSDSTRNDFVDRASKVYGSALSQQIDLEDTYTQQGTTVYGLPKEAVDLIIRDIRATGSVSDIAFGMSLSNMSDEQLLDLKESGLLLTPGGN